MMTVKRKEILMKKMKMRRLGRRLINSPRSRQAKGAMRRETFGDMTRRGQWLPGHRDSEITDSNKAKGECLTEFLQCGLNVTV